MPQNFKQLSVLLLLTTLALLVSLPQQAHAQFTPPDLTLETHALVSSSGTTPFWLQSNRHGMFSSEGSQFLTRIQAHSTNNPLTNFLNFSYGADFIARPVTQPTAFFNQGYVRLDAWNLFLQAGRFHNTSPIHDEELGMGSLGVSGNATPIPQIRAGLTDWTSLPFTRNFVQIKGHMAHGWLGSERYVSDVLYHEKVGHARFGGDFPLNLYGGIAQYVLWGGNSPEKGQLDSSIDDFFRVLIAVSASEGAAEGSNFIIGDQKGAWDFGFYLELDAVDVKVYRQFPLETKDNLKLKSPQDALTGISVLPGRQLNLPITQLTYEFLYTKHQDGPRRENIGGDLTRDRYRGNENYYNHGVYRSGWVYNSSTIGNPLFVPSSDPMISVFNNRIVAHHLGMAFSLPQSIQLTTKATFSRNYGKRWDNRIPEDSEKAPLFDPSIDQWSFYIGMETQKIIQDIPFTFNTEFGFDHGALIGNQIGLLIGIKWAL
ncbi:capsule assembly Wzi family protein [Rhodohalobacter sp. 8-1]|uniref:capsule assembly Wzi family protein n=1 Tax=Rhodohalobacter sp. 8-1 TaxID=3131972 RepID=UPI0030ECEA04